MRFNKYPKFEFVDTARKRSAIARKHKKECEKYPLLNLIGEIETPNVDEIMEQRKKQHAIDDINDRRRHAADWKRVRNLLRLHPEKKAIYFYWQTYSLTATPVYLLSLINQWEDRKRDRVDAEKRMNEFRRQRGESDIPENKSLFLFLKRVNDANPI